MQMHLLFARLYLSNPSNAAEQRESGTQSDVHRVCFAEAMLAHSRHELSHSAAIAAHSLSKARSQYGVEDGRASVTSSLLSRDLMIMLLFSFFGEEYDWFGIHALNICCAQKHREPLGVKKKKKSLAWTDVTC